MAQEIEAVDVGQNAELLRLAEDVARTGASRVLRHNGEALAIVGPVASPGRRSRSRREASPNAWLDGLRRELLTREVGGPAEPVTELEKGDPRHAAELTTIPCGPPYTETMTGYFFDELKSRGRMIAVRNCFVGFTKSLK
mgnify:CR=1 FL=1